MNQTQKLLNETIENARMGADACAQLIKKAEEADLRQELMRQKQVYESAVCDAEALLQASGAHPGSTPVSERMGLWIGTQMNTLMDKTASHIADMTIQGASMGIISLTKVLNSCPEADAQAKGIVQALLQKQQEGIDRMKTYLTEPIMK